MRPATVLLLPMLLSGCAATLPPASPVKAAAPQESAAPAPAPVLPPAPTTPRVAWPDVSKPLPTVGGGEKDAAVIVGLERYANVPGVPGAGRNAEDWYRYLTGSRGVSPAKVTLLKDKDGTLEKLRRFAQEAAAKVEPGGTLWFVFVGHGAPAKDGKDGLLVGYDVQQEADSLFSRSLPQSELVKALEAGAQARTVLVVDACFSGRARSGESLVPGLQPLIVLQPQAGASRTTVLSAARADQFAGPLPGAPRPAFSYLVLGGLRGWADRDADGQVGAAELVAYSQEALAALVKDRTQTPELSGPAATGLARAQEKGPDLAKLALAAAGGGDVTFADGVRAEVPEFRLGEGDFSEVNLAAEQALEAVLDVQEKKSAPPEAHEAAWCALAAVKEKNPYLAKAEEACGAWREYLAAVETLKGAVTKDLHTLLGYMRLKRKTAEDKLRVTDSFLRTYAPLAYTSQGKVGLAVREALLAGRSAELEAGIVSRRDERSGLARVWQPAPPPVENAPPAHTGFWMDRTEVTVRAYRACVQAGACVAPEEGVGCTWVPGDVRTDALPVTCATREQAESFCAWTSGRLPTLTEWRYAAQGGEDRPYPWGDAAPDEARAWFNRKPDVRQVGLAAAGASRWGVLDLAGNVSEFTRGERPKVVYAVGGSFRDSAEGVRADAAVQEDGFASRAHLGFRCVE